VPRRIRESGGSVPEPPFLLPGPGYARGMAEHEQEADAAETARREEEEEDSDSDSDSADDSERGSG
jgi:hypothetical protein